MTKEEENIENRFVKLEKQYNELLDLLEQIADDQRKHKEVHDRAEKITNELLDKVNKIASFKRERKIEGYE